MLCTKSGCDLGPILSPALLAGLLLCSVGTALAQCPPGCVPISPGAPYGSASAYQGCYSGTYQSPRRLAPLGGRFRQAIRSQEVYRSEARGWTPGPSPRVVYAPPIWGNGPSMETYSSYTDAMSYQRCTPVYSAPPSVGGAMGWAPYPASTCYPGYGAASWSYCPGYP